MIWRIFKLILIYIGVFSYISLWGYLSIEIGWLESDIINILSYFIIGIPGAIFGSFVLILWGVLVWLYIINPSINYIKGY